VPHDVVAVLEAQFNRLHDSHAGAAAAR